jgi:methylaspartate mutase epsilon subunit
MNLGDFVRRQHDSGALVVQPRMGFADPAKMRAGLLATREAAATTIGTITLDSYTRVGDLESIRQALRAGIALNGYPIVSYDLETTLGVLDGVVGQDFPVQVRHGSAQPQDIFRALARAGLHATEGGPVSYCLPYGRVPLAESVRNWAECCELALGIRESGVEPHLETFGGCMLGQLCPPSQLVAISVLEALFFHRNGLRSLSVSYAQQTSLTQDQEAVRALQRLCAELLPAADIHIVVYTYMGLAPKTPLGMENLLAQAVELAVTTGAQRLIVKTTAEAHRIPTIAENVAALEHAATVSKAHRAQVQIGQSDTGVYREAFALIDAVLNAGPEIGSALVNAFRHGLLDIPYCLHPDNAGRSRSYLDSDGSLRWAEIGSLPLAGVTEGHRHRAITSGNLLETLSHVQRTFDAESLAGGAPPAPALQEEAR